MKKFFSLLFLLPALLYAGWSPIQSLSSTGGYRPQISVDHEGNASAIWYQSSSIQFSFKPKGFSWSKAESLSESESAGDSYCLSINPSPKAPPLILAAWNCHSSAPISEQHTQLCVRSHPFNYPTPLYTTPSLSLMGLTLFHNVFVGLNGDLAAIWMFEEGPKKNLDHVSALIRPSSALFWPSSFDFQLNDPLMSRYASDTQIVIDSKGKATALWLGGPEKANHLYITSRDPKRALWMPSIDYGPATNPHLIIDSNDNLYLSFEDDLQVWLMTQPHDQLWSSPSLVSPQEEKVCGSSLAVNEEGNILILWINITKSDAHFIEAVEGKLLGGLSPYYALSNPTSADLNAMIAMNGKGNAAAIWSESFPFTSKIYCNVKPSSKPFSKANAIQISAEQKTTPFPQIAISDCNTLFAIWQSDTGISALEGNSLFTTEISPPRNAKIKQITHRFLKQIDLINQISWDESTTPGVEAYELFRDGKFLASVKGHSYRDHHRHEKRRYHYAIYAICKDERSKPLEISCP